MFEFFLMFDDPLCQQQSPILLHDAPIFCQQSPIFCFNFLIKKLSNRERAHNVNKNKVKASISWLLNNTIPLADKKEHHGPPSIPPLKVDFFSCGSYLKSMNYPHIYIFQYHITNVKVIHKGGSSVCFIVRKKNSAKHSIVLNSTVICPPWTKGVPGLIITSCTFLWKILFWWH